MRHIVFGAATFVEFLAALWLKFFAQEWLQGNAYDVVLVALLSSATFAVRNTALVKLIGDAALPDVLRRSQLALNRRVAAAWVILAIGAEAIQGIMTLVTGKPALGTFDPIDLACYVLGGIISFSVNRLLYITLPRQ
jgi:hypothetical protein